MIYDVDQEKNGQSEDASIERVAPPVYSRTEDTLADAMGLYETDVKQWVALYSTVNENMSANLTEDSLGSRPTAGRDGLTADTRTHTHTHHAKIQE